MHPSNSRTGSRHSRNVTASTATGLQLVGPALMHSMDQVFTVIEQLDHLLGDPDGAGHAGATSGWLHQLRCARRQLDDVLLGHDQMHELLSNLQALTEPQASARAPLDLNRCLSRVAYITQALVPPHLRIVQRMGTVPVIHGSVSALTQALIGLTAHAAHAIAHNNAHGRVEDLLTALLAALAAGLAPLVLNTLGDGVGHMGGAFLGSLGHHDRAFLSGM